ncbi:MAG: ketosteroid isomerase-like protein [Alteromonas macleodii]|jgi:ketosteroid isomerase-like protein
MNNQEISRALFNAFMSGDDNSARALCNDTLKARQNGGAPMTLDMLLVFAKAVRDITKDFRYENVVCSDTGKGFVEEHDVCATLSDGSLFLMPVCVVAEVEHGKITRLSEYFDTAAAKNLAKALSAAG